MKFRNILLITIFSFIFILSSLANEDSTRTYYLKSNIITGTRIETSQSNIPATISVISAEEIKESGKSSVLSIINDAIPGIFITERGILGYGASQGAAGGISIRGIGGSPTNQVLLLIDGRPQFMGIFGHPFPDNYLSSNTERIEVIKGPASVVYGTNAMGGVINLITKKNNPDGFSANLNGSVSSYKTYKGDLGIGYKLNDFSFFASYNHSETEGHRDYTNFNMNSGYIKSSYKISDAFSVNLDGNTSKFRTYDPGTTQKPLKENWIEISRGSIGFSIDNNFDKFNGGIKVYHNWGQNDVYDGWHSTDNNTNFLLYQNMKLFPENIITLGIDYKNYGGEAENKLMPGFSKSFIEGKRTVDETAIYLLTQHFITANLIANAGLRYENNSMFGGYWVPQAGMAYHINEDMTVKGIISKGFRSPTIKDLYMFPPANKDLKPEEMWNYEISMLNNLNDNLSLESSFFIASGKNLILTVGNPPNAKLMNSGEFAHKGFELLAKYYLPKNLSFSAGYSYLDPENQTRANPKHKINFDINYNINKFSIRLDIKQIMKLYGADNSTNPLDDYTLVNSIISYKFINNTGIFLSIDNILDKSYQIIYGYPMPGRTFALGINLNY